MKQLFYNGKIFGLHDKNEISGWFLIENGKFIIVKPGLPDKELLADSKKVDLMGARVLPGFIDSHLHLRMLGMKKYILDLKNISTIKDLLENLNEFKKNVLEETWIRGFGWDDNRYPALRKLHRKHLDSVCSKKPVALTRIDGHAMLVNTKALEIAGIMDSENDPHGGHLGRFSSGKLNGLLNDRAIDIVQSCIPLPEKKQLIQAYLYAQDECLSHGITGVNDLGEKEFNLNLMEYLSDSGALKIQIYSMLDALDNETLTSRISKGQVISGSSRFQCRAVKIYIDGALGSGGAALTMPYKDNPGMGLLIISSEKLYNLLNLSIETGFQTVIHAIGDRGINIALNTIKKLNLDSTYQENLRIRLEHLQLMNKNDISLMRDLGIIASIQPFHFVSDSGWLPEKVVLKKEVLTYPWKTFIENKIKIALGTDAPIETLNPFAVLQACVIRKQVPWEDETITESLSIEDAIRFYTLGSAYASFQENETGSITQGKWGDFIIISEDIINIPKNRISEITVKETYVKGEKLFPFKNAN